MVSELTFARAGVPKALFKSPRSILAPHRCGRNYLCLPLLGLREMPRECACRPQNGDLTILALRLQGEGDVRTVGTLPYLFLH